MSSSFASDATQELLLALDNRSSVTPTDSGVATASASDHFDVRANYFRTGLRTLRGKALKAPLLPAELLALVWDVQKQTHSSNQLVTANSQSEAYEWQFYASVVLEAYCSALNALMNNARHLQSEIEYWTRIENGVFGKTTYLVQSVFDP